MAEFRMPSLGADMDEGKLVEWLVKVGDVVRKGDVVAVVDTAKADIEVECFTDGPVESLLVQPGETVAVGAPLAILGTAGEPGPAPALAGRPTALVESVESVERPAEPSVPLTGPIIRRLAAQLEVDLTKVRGTGRGGTITRADVQKAAAVRPGPAKASATAPVIPPQSRARISPYARKLAGQLGVDLATVRGQHPGGTVDAEAVRQAAGATKAGSTSASPKADAMRQATARLMARSKREIPHYYLGTTVDVTDALTWLRARNKERTVHDRILLAALLLKASALAATRVPELNGFWIDDRFSPGTTVNLGVAVAVRGGGLVTPAISNAAELELPELMNQLRDLIGRARTGRVRGAELSAGTITVTNLGDLGVESVYGVIYPPQVALVGFGRVLRRPWAVDGQLAVRSIVSVTLSADHRATDGHTGARFLDLIDQFLQQPEKLWEANSHDR